MTRCGADKVVVSLSEENWAVIQEVLRHVCAHRSGEWVAWAAQIDRVITDAASGIAQAGRAQERERLARRREAEQAALVRAVRAVVRQVSGVTIEESGYSETEGPYVVMKYVAHFGGRIRAFTRRVTKPLPYQELEEWTWDCGYRFEGQINGESYAARTSDWGLDND